MDRPSTPARPPWSPITPRQNTASPARNTQHVMLAQPSPLSHVQTADNLPVPQSVQRETREEIRAMSANQGTLQAHRGQNQRLPLPAKGNTKNPLDNRPNLAPPTGPRPNAMHIDRMLAQNQVGVSTSPNAFPADVSPPQFEPNSTLRTSIHNLEIYYQQHQTRQQGNYAQHGGTGFTSAVPAPTTAANPPATPTPAPRPRPCEPHVASALGPPNRALVPSPLGRSRSAANPPLGRSPTWTDIMPSANQSEHSSSFAAPQRTPIRPFAPLREVEPFDPSPFVAMANQRARERPASRASSHASRRSPDRRQHPYLRSDPRARPAASRRGGVETGDVAGARSGGFGNVFEGRMTVNGVFVQGTGPVYIYPSGVRVDRVEEGRESREPSGSE